MDRKYDFEFEVINMSTGFFFLDIVPPPLLTKLNQLYVLLLIATLLFWDLISDYYIISAF